MYSALFKRVVGVLIIVSFLASSFQQAYAISVPAGAQSAPQSPNMQRVASVNIQNATMSQAPAQLNLSFDISNGAGIQHNVEYGVELVSKNGTQQFVADQRLYPDVLTLQEHTTLHKNIIYPIPPGLPAGSYAVVLLAKNTSGFPLAISAVGAVNLTASAGLGIEANSCYLQVVGEKSGEKYSLGQGVDINADESLKLTCTGENSTGATQTVLPTYETHYRTTFGEVVAHSGGDTAAVAMPAGTHAFSLVLPKAQKPQAYDLLVGLSGNGFTTNSITVHYVIDGASATIQNMSFPADSYAAGHTAMLSFISSQAADTFVGARHAGSGGAVAYTAHITSAGGAQCAAPVQGTLAGDRTQVAVKLTRDCANPHVQLALTDEKGAVLAEQELDIQSGPIGHALPLIPIAVALAALVALGAFAWFVRGKGIVPFLVVFALVTMPSAMPVHVAKADTFCTSGGHVWKDSDGTHVWTTDCLYYYVVNLDKSTYTPGASVQTTGQVQSDVCDNEVINNFNVSYATLVGSANYSSETHTIFDSNVPGESLSDYADTASQCDTTTCYGDPVFGSATYTAPSTNGTYSIHFTGTGKYEDADGNLLSQSNSIDSPFSVTGGSVGTNVKPVGGLDSLDCNTFNAWGYDPNTPSQNVTLSFTSGGAGSFTFGETNLLGTDDYGMDNGIYAQSYSLGTKGTLQSLSIYVSNPAGLIGMGLYDATGPGGGPGNKLAETAQFTAVSGWNTANVTSPVTLSPGTYWMAYWTSSQNLSTRRQDNVGSISYYPYTNSAMPSTWSTSPWTASQHWSFYATLTNGSSISYAPNTTRSDINYSYGITGTHGYSYAFPSSLKDGVAHTVQIFLNDTSGGTNTDITNGGIQMTCGSTAPSATISAQGCTLSTAGTCSAYVTWKGTNTNGSSIDLLQTAPDGTQTKITNEPAASTTISRTVSQTGTYTFSVYDYNKSFATSSFLGKVNVKILPTPELNCNSAAQDCSMKAGKSVQLDWSCATNPSDTSSSGGNFSTGGALTGSAVLTPSNTTTYTLQCLPSGSTISRKITVNSPDLTLTVSPKFVKAGNTAVISWNAQNVDSCTLSGAGVAMNGVAGSTTVTVSNQSTYTLLCQSGVGPQSVTKTLNLVPELQER